MARQIVPTLHCDRCGGIVQVNDVKETPKGWFQISVGCDNEAGKRNAGTFDFCSELCIERWANERRKALAGESEKKTCPYCEKEFALKGFHTHEVACKRNYEELTTP